MIKSRHYTYAQAMRMVVGNEGRRYPRMEDKRYDDGLVFPVVSPGFEISNQHSVFTIGSCFARNIEEELAQIGVDVASLRYSVPREEAPGRSNAVLNQYNAGSMAEIVKMTMDDGHIRGGFYEQTEGMYGDALLSSTINLPVPMERIEARRKEIVSLYQNGLGKADIVVITLGLIECWYDLEDQVYLNAFPTAPIAKSNPERFEFRRLGVQDCLDLLSEMIERLVANGPKNILLTVSPVPLGTTFMKEDALVANMASKSVLRVVAEELTMQYDFVDYFPSYEMVMTSGFPSYFDDLIHVRNEVVGRIVNYMIERYATRPGQVTP